MLSKQYGLSGTYSIIEIGKGGSKLKNNSGVLELRNNADGAFVIGRCLDPSGDDDIVNKRYLKTIGATTIVTGQFDGAAPPAAGGLTGQIYICTKTGGGYTEAVLYYSNGSSWIALSISRGAMIVIGCADLTGNTIELAADSVYEWTGSVWKRVSPFDRYKSLVYTDTGIKNIGVKVPINGIVLRVTVCVTTIFDGTTPVLKIGDTDSDNRYLDTTEIDLTTPAVYVTQAYYKYVAARQLISTLTIGGSPSQGACDILVQCGSTLV